MLPQDRQSVDQSLIPLMPPSEEEKPEGSRQNKILDDNVQIGRSRFSVLADRLLFLPVLSTLLLGIFLLAFSISAWSNAGGLPIGLAGIFLGIMFLAMVGAYLPHQERQRTTYQSLMPIGTGLRAAVILILVMLVGFELDLLRTMLAADGLAAKLLPTPGPQNPGISWSSAFVLAAFIAAITTLALFTLSGIWRLARED